MIHLRSIPGCELTKIIFSPTSQERTIHAEIGHPDYSSGQKLMDKRQNLREGTIS